MRLISGFSIHVNKVKQLRYLKTVFAGIYGDMCLHSIYMLFNEKGLHLGWGASNVHFDDFKETRKFIRLLKKGV